MNGKIKFLVADKGYGFIIAEDGKEYFFHASGLQGIEFDRLRKEDSVKFELGTSPKGLRAENINLG